MTLKRLAGYGPAFVLAVSLFLIWELVVRAGLIASNLLPTPVAIVRALYDNWDVIFGHTVQTSLETVIGLLIATVLGLGLAILLDLSEGVKRAVYPLLITSQTIPMVALAPLLVIWFGFELTPKIIVVTLYCFFPIVVACLDGLLSTDPQLMKLLHSMKASRWQTLWLVRLPGAMPSFFSGLRIAATYSVTGAIVGEYVAAQQGLGLYMKTAASSNAIVLVFAAIVITAVLSLLLFGLVSVIEGIALPWHQRQGRKC
ncbi:nitrate ABC transporter permease [Dictyobacter sp. S3.2.2.5]|uniref:Nitrate ABC transporter permease n=1 Tax=Dictyobacter halimunensis TaxID=3026934 RepID=A0ABQ6FRQ7_9CHLR|nr:nitrate ABC transporter permease [Dictyobacter sp. S3.2.2.5]